MIGRTSGSSDYLRVRYKSDIEGCKDFADLFGEAASTYTELKFDVGSSAGGGSDHADFWNRGYYTIFYYRKRLWQ